MIERRFVFMKKLLKAIFNAIAETGHCIRNMYGVC